ncbi:MAG: hypothetical protein AAGH79_01965 [Bacteroidota bacterium]
MIEQKIEALLQEKFQEEDFQDCFLIEVNLHANNKLEVFLDADSGITFAKCQRLSRYLEGFIDEEQWLGPKYVLEVSSPGLSRPLKLKRQYLKNQGRKVEVTTKSGEKQVGLLLEIGEDAIVLEQQIKEKVGKKNVKKTIQTPILFSDIQKTIVKIQF